MIILDLRNWAFVGQFHFELQAEMGGRESLYFPLILSSRDPRDLLECLRLTKPTIQDVTALQTDIALHCNCCLQLHFSSQTHRTWSEGVESSVFMKAVVNNKCPFPHTRPHIIMWRKT